MMKNKILFIVLLGLNGCANELIQQEVIKKMPTEQKSDLHSIASANNAFAFDMYHQLVHKEQNLFFSPLSISEVMAMTYVGARTETKAELGKVLHFNMSDYYLKYAFRGLDMHLKSVNDTKGYMLKIANAIYPEQSFAIEKNFSTEIEQFFSSRIETMDYLHHADEAKNSINQWIAKQTNNRILNMIPSIDPNTKLILINTVYFKAKWQDAFDTENTNKNAFTLLSGEDREVEMMHQNRYLAYTEGNDYQAVTLAYKGGATSMVVILPAKGKFEKVLKKLNVETLKHIKKTSTWMYKVALSLPKFKMTTDTMDLIPYFKKLGVKQAFLDSADFSGISENKGLKISQILHKAFIEVSEKETEATAATVVMMELTSAMPSLEPPKTKIMNVNRPFIIVVKDNETEQILFMGTIVDPRG